MTRVAFDHSYTFKFNHSYQSDMDTETCAMHMHSESDLLGVIIIAGQACTRVLGESVQVAHKQTHSGEWCVCITKPLFVTGRP